MSKFFQIFLLLLLTIEITIEKEEAGLNQAEDGNNQKEDHFKNMNFTNVLTITDENYSSIISKYEVLYLIIYVEWCQHCKNTMPHFIDAANYAKEKEMGVTFAKLDGDKNKNVTNEFSSIYGYPSIFLLYKGEKIFFSGEKTKEGLIRFVNKKLNGSVEIVEKIKEIDDMIKKDKTILISSIKDKLSTIYTSFKSFSEKNDNIEYISCTSEECIKKYGQDITLLKPFDEKINYYSKDFGPLDTAKNNSIDEFIGIFGIEAGGIIGEKEINMLFEHNKKFLYFARNSSDLEQTKYDSLFKQLGKELRSNNTYSLVGDIKGNKIFNRINSVFLVSKEELPSVIYFDLDNEKEDTPTYRIINADNKQLTKENILNFIKDIKKGKIKKDLETELPPTKENLYEFGAKTIVGRTFEKYVIKEPKNVCLLFTMRDYQCDLCKKYSEIFKILGNKYKEQNNSKVIYARIDVSSNEIENINFNEEKPPFIYLYTNNLPEKKIIKFEPKNNMTISELEVEKFVSEKLGLSTDEKKENKTITDL